MRGNETKQTVPTKVPLSTWSQTLENGKWALPHELMQEKGGNMGRFSAAVKLQTEMKQ